MKVVFRKRGRTRKVWKAEFRCGGRDENNRAALLVAWETQSEILSVK